jgi:hypothetical protein
MPSESTDDQRILQCIDDGLQTLGDSGKKAIYYYLKKNFKLKRQKIPKKPEIFCRGLTLMFGDEGADIIEKWIIEKLKTSFHLEHQSDIKFAKAIDIIKSKQEKRLDNSDCK